MSKQLYCARTALSAPPKRSPVGHGSKKMPGAPVHPRRANAPPLQSASVADWTSLPDRRTPNPRHRLSSLADGVPDTDIRPTAGLCHTIVGLFILPQGFPSQEPHGLSCRYVMSTR